MGAKRASKPISRAHERPFGRTPEAATEVSAPGGRVYDGPVPRSLSSEQARLLLLTDTARCKRHRRSHPGFEPDLSDANLRSGELAGVDLSGADLHGVDLRDADLSDANVSGFRGLASARFGSSLLGGAQLDDPLPFASTLGHVDESIRATRTLFLSSMAASVYSLITLASTSDLALFTNAGSTRLPIVNSKIAIVDFFVVAPVLLLALYLWMALSSVRLWEALAAVPAVSPTARRPTSASTRGSRAA